MTVSSSLIALKSLSNPDVTLVVTGTALALGDGERDMDVITAGAMVAEAGVGNRAVEVVGGTTDRVTDGCLRTDGGIMFGGSSLEGGSFPRTFSAIRYMARANCSALSLPLFCTSQRFLGSRGRESYTALGSHLSIMIIITSSCIYL